VSGETPNRKDLLNTLRAWQGQDLQQANRWLAENRTLFRDAVLHDREDARREIGRRLIQATAERN
jgi:hypothetical protein